MTPPPETVRLVAVSGVAATAGWARAQATSASAASIDNVRFMESPTFL
jgi:hypothetical protein